MPFDISPPAKKTEHLIGGCDRLVSYSDFSPDRAPERHRLGEAYVAQARSSSIIVLI